MKRRLPFLFSIVLAICFVLLVLCKGKRYEIRRANGHVIVENHIPGQLRVPADKIRFQEIFSIGTDSGDENYMFYGFLKIRIDRRHDIYVLDMKDQKISKYNKFGQFVWRTGKKGQGPGELESPFDFSIGQDDKIFILDYPSTIEIFSTDGLFIDALKLDKAFCSIDVMEDGRLLLNELATYQTAVCAFVYSVEGKLERQFLEPYQYGPKNLGGGGFSSEKAIRCLDHKIYFCLPDRYEIREYDLQGKLLRIIRRDKNLTPFNIKTQDGMLSSLSVRDRSGPCFLWKSEYLINILTLHKAGQPREWDMDFFDKKGFYLGSVPLPEDTALNFVDDEGNAYFVQRFPFPRIICKRLLIN
jgi:hypothetical protein